MEERICGDRSSRLEIGETISARPSDLTVNEHRNADPGHAELSHTIVERGARRWLTANDEGREQRGLDLTGRPVGHGLAAGDQRGYKEDEAGVIVLHECLRGDAVAGCLQSNVMRDDRTVMHSNSSKE